MGAFTMSKRVADVLIETLQAAGVKRCYGIVGDTLNRIAHAIQESKIEWVRMRHEEAGAFAASAEGQFTGELVACAGSCGPGSLHFINGLYEANRNRAPVILIATQVEFLNNRVQVFHLLRGERARARHHPRHQQRYAEGFDAIDFAHVVSPWSGKWNRCESRDLISLPLELGNQLRILQGFADAFL
jgi:hypothetical protein